MLRRTTLAALLALASGAAQAALGPGSLAFTSFNADEDGWSMVTFSSIAANTTVFFSDNEWDGTAFNTGESYHRWVSGDSAIAAGSVIRFLATDKTTLSASHGTLLRETVSGSSNWGTANSNETIYVYQGTDALTPASFIAAVTNGTFAANGPLTGTGLVEGSTAIRLNLNAPSASPDYAEYTGPRSGQASFDAYKPLVADVANWMVDTTSGAYADTIPDTTAFTITPVPEPETYALMLAGLGLVGWAARRRSAGR